MGKIKTPDGQEIELKKGEALAQREDGKWEVIKPKQVEGATRTVNEDYKQLLGEVVTAAQEGRVEREKMVTALNDLTAAVGKLPRNDPAMEPDAPPHARRVTLQRRPAAHEVAQHRAQTQCFVVAGQHQMCEKIHAARLADEHDGFWLARDHLRYHARILRRPAAPAGAASETGPRS